MISQFFKTDVHKFLCAVTLQLFFKELQNALFKGTVLQDFRPIGFFKYPRGVYSPQAIRPRGVTCPVHSLFASYRLP